MKVRIDPIANPVHAHFTASAKGKCQITNFGGNQTWQASCYQPGSEQEVLDILDRHRNGKVRPVGSLHSWSDVAVSSDATVDMSKFDSVSTYVKDGETLARIGAGTPLQKALDQLHASTDQTFPTLGAIKKQTISGAISTATHGSGRSSLSHYVEKIRVAAYDPETGEPKVFEYSDGEELRAARCGLGCQGVILSVDIKTQPKYLVEETVVQHDNLQTVLDGYQDKPLTQFTLVPYGWNYLSFERKPIPNRELSRGEKIKNGFFKAFNTAGVDVLWHALMKTSVWLGDTATKKFLEWTPHMVVKNVSRTDDSETVLTMAHDLFQHEEMEMFIPEDRLKESVEVLKYATQVFAGEDVKPPKAVEQKLRQIGMFNELQTNQGRYTQHYPFFFRKVMPEDAMISMASGNKPYFSLSVFTYNAPDDREAYSDFCSWLGRCMHKMSDARLHWGKHFPLGHQEMSQVYPELPRFQELCDRTDPNGVFRNDYTERVLGLPK